MIQKIRDLLEWRLADNLKAEENCKNGIFGSAAKEDYDILSFLDTLEKSNSKDFPTTDEEIGQFLATHPKVELPEKYKTPDWMFEKIGKPMNQELEAEIDKYREEHLFAMPAFQQVARHFAVWGAEHLKK